MSCRLLIVAAAGAALCGCFGNAPPALGATGTAAAGAAVPVPAHRLNQAEYNATVRDLLPTTSTPADAFPNDGPSVNGLDNMASDLTLSPALFAGYEQAARDLAHEIVDPLDATQVPPTYAPAHRWITCDPHAGDPNACAQQIITAFAERAWRRPLAAGDAANLMVLWRAQTFDWEANLRTVLATVLISPRFIFRLERVAGTGTVPLDGYQVASRLSYFLWSSMPDPSLLDAAASGELQTPEGIVAQARRLLADPRAAALGTNFASQWLDARYLSHVTPDPNVFPSFNPNIALAMAAETDAFFAHFLASQEPVQNMFTAKYTFAGDELARFYGLPPPGSAAPAQVATPSRYGLLSLGAWLTVTSMPNRTSPTKRGAWILTQLMCESPPEVPAGVNTSLPDATGAGVTIRQQMSQHDTDPACASCHALMDPSGFGLENFTGVATYRDSYPNASIDTTGTLAGGAHFDGPAQLATLLAQDARFPACLSAKLFAYAMGTLTTPATQPALDAVTAAWAAKNYTLPALIETIVATPAFRSRWVEP